jgi:hypothetical protein
MSVVQGIFNNHYKAAMHRVRVFLKENKILGDDHGIKHKQMILWFAEKHNLSVIGKPRQWLVSLYLSGVCSNCKQQTEDHFYSSKSWLTLRDKVLQHYDYFCMKCGSGKEIRVDHIKPRSLFPELELSFDNMQVLCNTCNLHKSNKYFTDYRPKILCSL